MEPNLPLSSFLILDYCRPAEGKLLLESLKKYLKIPAKIIYSGIPIFLLSKNSKNLSYFL